MMEYDIFFLTESGDTPNLIHTLEDSVLLFIKKKAIVSLIVTDGFREELPTVLAVIREFASDANPCHDCWYCQIRHLKPIFPWAAEEPFAVLSLARFAWFLHWITA